MKFIKVDVINNSFSFDFSRLSAYYNQKEDLVFIDSLTENQMYLAPFDYIDRIDLNPDIENTERKDVQIPFECNCNYADTLDLQLLRKFHYSWYNEMCDFLRSDTFKNIMLKIKKLRNEKEVYPHQDLLLSSFLVDLSKIKGVWIGESPYPSFDHANGTAFCTWNKKLPKPLAILIDGIKRDLNLDSYFINNDLLDLKMKGIFFIDYSLATTKDKKELIETFRPLIDEVVKVLNKKENLSVILFGDYAKKLLPLFNSKYNIYTTSYPSVTENSIWDTNKVFKNFNNNINLCLGK